MNVLLAALAAYLIGALPWALWVGKLARGVDVRQHGSGNLGATNVYRTLGPGLGWTVFLLDAGKGVLAVLGARLVGGPDFPGGSGSAGMIGALFAVLGHAYTPFAGFKGGKGAATSAGAMIAMAPRPAALCLLCFLVAALASKRISVGSITAAVTLPIFLWLVPWSWSGKSAAVAGSIVALFILVRHIPNMKRIAAGTEPVFYLRKKA